MKKFWIIVCVIAVIIFLGYIGKDMDLSSIGGNNTNSATNSNVITAKNNTTNTNKNNNTEKKENETNETSSKNNVNNTEDKTKNETTNNTTTNTTENNNPNTANETDKNNQTPAVEEVTVSDEDKAKELAQKTYGSSDGVYFKIEQVESNGVYIISVRDMETTSALAWYTVNAKTGTVK